MTSLSKVDIKNFLYFGIILGLCLISIGNFLIPNHIALPNLSTLGIAVICIIIMVINRKIYFSLPVDVLICNSGIVLVFLVGCLIHHENAETTFSYVRFTTVILGYTFTLLFVPSLSKETYKYVIYSFISIVLALSVICIYNFIYYTNHPELTPIAPNTSLIDVIIYQKVVPNNIVYHLFGFFVCFSIILIYWVIYIYKPNLKKIENGILLTLFVYFVIFVTYIGSRTSLIITYVFLIYITFRYFLKKKNKLIPLTIAVGFVIILVCFYKYTPLVNRKIDKTVDELRSLKDNNVASGRFFSYQIALKVIEANFWTGVSFSKYTQYVDAYIDARYDYHYEKSKVHNQFLNFACKIGVPLATLLWLCCYLPFLIRFKKSYFIINAFYLMFLFYSMIDVPFDMKHYFYFYSFWMPLLWHIHYAKQDNKY